MLGRLKRGILSNAVYNRSNLREHLYTMKTGTILLVDDNADFRALFRQALKSKNVDLVTHDTAITALEYLRSAAELPALTLVDLRMPEMSGEEFIQTVRSDAQLKDLKVVVTSGWNNLGSVAKNIGAD